MAKKQWYQEKTSQEKWQTFVKNYFEWYSFAETLAYVMELKPAHIRQLISTIQDLCDTAPDQLLEPFTDMDMIVLIDKASHQATSIQAHEAFFRSVYGLLEEFIHTTAYKIRQKSETDRERFHQYRQACIHRFLQEQKTTKDFLLNL